MVEPRPEGPRTWAISVSPGHHLYGRLTALVREWRGGVAYYGQHGLLQVELPQLSRWPRLVGLELHCRGRVAVMAIPGDLHIAAVQGLRDFLKQRLRRNRQRPRVHALQLQHDHIRLVFREPH